MTITFFSNYLNHHEIPFCDELYKNPDVIFYFVQTEPMDQERIAMGWNADTEKYPYLKHSYKDRFSYNECLDLGINSDVVLFGSAPNEFIAERVKHNKLTFYYAERLFKKGFIRAFYPPSTIKIFKRFIHPGWKSNFFMLCASGFTSYDVSRIFTFSKKCFNWGHFPQFIEQNIEELLTAKKSDTVELLWVGRFIKFKNPHYSILIAKKLKDEGIKFNLKIIGSGELETEIKTLINNFGLTSCVQLMGSMSPNEVREYMDKADVFLFTSDFNEGWGAVLYEAMNSGCAVVASHAIGAVPLMLKHNENGLIYRNGDTNDLFNKTKWLISNNKNRIEMGRNAYSSLKNLWNAEEAALRFYNFSLSVLQDKSVRHFEEGPMSKSGIRKNNWFKK